MRRNHGGGIKEEKSLRRNNVGGIKEEESLRRNHGRGFAVEGPLRRDQAGGIVEELEGGIREVRGASGPGLAGRGFHSAVAPAQLRGSSPAVWSHKLREILGTRLIRQNPSVQALFGEYIYIDIYKKTHICFT